MTHPDCESRVMRLTAKEMSFDLQNRSLVGTVRIRGYCRDCGDMLADATLMATGDVPAQWWAQHTGPGHALKADAGNTWGVIERWDSGPGGRAQRIFRVSATVPITCTCGGDAEVRVQGEQLPS